MQKVGVTLNKKECVQNILKEVGGIAKTSDFISAGLKNYDVANLCKDGVIQRVRRGFYKLSINDNIVDEQLIAMLLPHGIICVESALFYYGYNDYLPRQWSIAIPRSMSRMAKKMTEVPIKTYYIQKEYMELGKTVGNFNNVQIPVYDRERTICDCFKYRTKIDNEIVNKALNAYISDDKKNLSNLSKYAKKMKVYTKVMNVMEVLING